MKYIVAAVLAVLIATPALAQQNRDRPFLLCQNVKDAKNFHDMVTADPKIFKPLANKVINSGVCDVYEGASKWKFIDKNDKYGYAKIVYDTHTTNPKIGYMPYVDVFAMGEHGR